jgi:hypothetical protein
MHSTLLMEDILDFVTGTDKMTLADGHLGMINSQITEDADRARSWAEAAKPASP